MGLPGAPVDTIGDLALRFVLGGAIVSMFAVIAELFKPRSFSGLFGAAPSVAIATLALTYATDGRAAAATAARWMVAGAIALFVYSSCCVVICRGRQLPVWLGAATAWLAWLAVAVSLWFSLTHLVRT
jgi:uncharacterized membrane protein (GlpM family)